MTRFLALLRGINVGGKNVVRMAELRAFLTDRGFSGVRTYIQSGNIIWDDPDDDRVRARARVEEAMAELMSARISVMIRTRHAMDRAVDGAPVGFGTEPERFRYDVMYLEDGLAAEDALEVLPLREGVDSAQAGEGLVYFSRLIAAASRSYLPRIVGTEIYRRMTIRNWNTTRRLRAMMTE